MITVTDRALKHILKLAERTNKEKVLRLGVRAGGCNGMEYTCGFDQPTERDTHWQFGDLTVVVDNRCLKFVEGTEIDYEDRNLLKAGFKFNNPNAKGSCGCGESFGV